MLGPCGSASSTSTSFPAWTASSTSAGSWPTPSTRWSWPTGSGSTTCGRSSTTSSRSTRTRARPEVFLAAASQRTSRIRLGHGIVQAPPAVNHPARVAERVATLDLISGGRVEFGTGEGSSQIELGGFGVDREREARPVGGVARRDHPDVRRGAVRRLRRPLDLDAAAKRGPEAEAAARTRRCGSRAAGASTILTAAQRRARALCRSRSSSQRTRRSGWTPTTRRSTSDRCVPAGFAVNPNVAVVLPMMCHRDEQTAIERGIDGAHFFGFSLAYYYAFGEHRPGRSNIWREFKRASRGGRVRPRDRHTRRRAARGPAAAAGTGKPARGDRHAGSDRGPDRRATRRPASTR